MGLNIFKACFGGSPSPQNHFDATPAKSPGANVAQQPVSPQGSQARQGMSRQELMERFQQSKSASSKISDAGQHLQSGKFQAAERAYRSVLTEHADSPTALRTAVDGLRCLSTQWMKVSQDRSRTPEVRKAASKKSGELRELADSFRA